PGPRGRRVRAGRRPRLGGRSLHRPVRAHAHRGMNPPSRLVLRFLASVGRPAEAELYLSLFRAERPESFALIAVDRDVTGVLAEALAVDLEFLAELGLTPVLA